MIVVCVLVLVTATVIVAVWKIPYAGQERVDQPVQELMLADAPALPGGWQQNDGQRGGEGGDLDRLGLDEQVSRSWNHGDGVAVTVWIGKYSSASRAGLEFSLRDPRQKRTSVTGALDEFEEISLQRLQSYPDHADENAYFCGKRVAGSAGCQVRWTWLRYGQYVVQTKTEDVPAPESGIPGWLFETVRDIDATLATRSPRV